MKRWSILILLYYLSPSDIKFIRSWRWPFHSSKVALTTVVIKPIKSQLIQNQGQQKAVLPVTDSKFVATEGNIARIIALKREGYHPWPFSLKDSILLVTFSLKVLVISYTNQTGRVRHNNNGGKMKFRQSLGNNHKVAYNKDITNFR